MNFLSETVTLTVWQLALAISVGSAITDCVMRSRRLDRALNRITWWIVCGLCRTFRRPRALPEECYYCRKGKAEDGMPGNAECGQEQGFGVFPDAPPESFLPDSALFGFKGVAPDRGEVADGNDGNPSATAKFGHVRRESRILRDKEGGIRSVVRVADSAEDVKSLAIHADNSTTNEAF